MSLSVAIIAKDEGRHIGAALASVIDLASEIVVLIDSRTRDDTASICHTYGARTSIEPWPGFPRQRNRALELCTGEWVLFLDADERLTDELQKELVEVLDSCQPRIVAYWIPRHNSFFGKILRGGGWSPDYQLRLLRRDRAHYDETRLVHEVADLEGEAGYLRNSLLHLNIERIDELWSKQRSYAIQEAHTLYRSGQRARWRNLLGAPTREFRRRYIDLQGYRDGGLGLFLCATLAYFEFIKYVHLMGLRRIGDSR